MAGLKNPIRYPLNGFGWVVSFIENLSLGSVSGQGYFFINAEEFHYTISRYTQRNYSKSTETLTGKF